MAIIYIIEADNTQHQFSLPAEEGSVATVGSREDCLISLPGKEGLAELHCSIALTNGEYVIKDEGSEGGVLEGERAISSEALREGVPYTLGSVYLYFAAEAPEEVPAEEAPAEEEPLAEPVPVSEYEESPVAEAPAAAAPAKKKKAKAKKKALSPLQKASVAMASQKTKRQAMSAINYVYVLLVLALAFYAGMSLRHWMVTGEFLPSADSAPAQTAKK